MNSTMPSKVNRPAAPSMIVVETSAGTSRPSAAR
jgi:hypothetical protein